MFIIMGLEMTRKLHISSFSNEKELELIQENKFFPPLMEKWLFMKAKIAQ